jgi:hypothetical protein
MLTIDPRAAEKIQPELLSGESIHWAAMPNPNKIFHFDDWYLIPFSLLWGGFAIFWEASVLGFIDFGNRPGQHAPLLYELWGIPFVIMGQYLIWGRFVYDEWLKHRTFYAVTNRRVLLLQIARNRKVQQIFLDAIPEITLDGDQLGTLWLGEKLSPFAYSKRGLGKRTMSRIEIGQWTPALIDIDNLNSVYRLILELREKARKQ